MLAQVSSLLRASRSYCQVSYFTHYCYKSIGLQTNPKQIIFTIWPPTTTSRYCFNMSLEDQQFYSVPFHEKGFILKSIKLGVQEDLSALWQLFLRILSFLLVQEAAVHSIFRNFHKLHFFWNCHCSQSCSLWLVVFVVITVSKSNNMGIGSKWHRTSQHFQFQMCATIVDERPTCYPPPSRRSGGGLHFMPSVLNMNAF